MLSLKQHLKQALQEQLAEIPTVIVDAIYITEQVYNSLTDKSGLVIEAKTFYYPIPGLKHYTHRYDKVFGEQKPGHQNHVHVFYDGKEMFAINADGSAHDGCHQVRIPYELNPFLQKKGIAIPPNNIIEMFNVSDSSKLLLESLSDTCSDERGLYTSMASISGEAIRSGQSFQLVETNCTSVDVLCNSKTRGLNIKSLYSNTDLDKVKEVRECLFHIFDDYPKFNQEVIEIFDEYKNTTPHSLFLVW